MTAVYDDYIIFPLKQMWTSRPRPDMNIKVAAFTVTYLPNNTNFLGENFELATNSRIFAKIKFSQTFLDLQEPRREKTGLRDFRPGPTQTGLYKLRKELEA